MTAMTGFPSTIAMHKQVKQVRHLDDAVVHQPEEG